MGDEPQSNSRYVMTTKFLTLYRVRRKLYDLGFVCFLTKYSFVCHILLGQVGIRQNWKIRLPWQQWQQGQQWGKQTTKFVSRQRIVYEVTANPVQNKEMSKKGFKKPRSKSEEPLC